MSPFSVLLILGSACMHVVVHISLKLARDRASFVWWMLLWAMVLFSPILLIFRQPIPLLGLGVIVLSSIFEASYFLAIAKAYRGADLSVVYPLARGTAPALLLIWSVLVLREDITAGGIAGVMTIAAGLYWINLPRLGAWREPLRALRQVGPRWALLAGLSTSLYTAIDKVGITLVTPFLYTYIALGITTFWVTPFALREVGWQGMLAELRQARWTTVLAGFMTLGAYGIVLHAMHLGTPASYAGAVREFSVVLGAAYGVIVLEESRSPMRLLASALVAAGVAMIGLLG
ncbi:MAG: DMT family transporter [Chloroflexota bacterium]